MHLYTPNSVTVHWFGCAIVSLCIIDWIKFMKGHWELFIRITFPLSKNSLKNPIRRVYTIKNMQFLAIEIYKALNNLSSPLMSQIFTRKDTKYNLRNNDVLVTNNVKTTAFGLHSLNHLGPKIWEIIPDNIKCSESLDTFKHKIKLWTPDKCPCTICRPDIHNLGYIE